VSTNTETLEARPDTPRSTYSLLSQRVTLVVVGVLVGLAAVAWWSTVRQANSMSDMVSGLGQVGVRASNDMTVPIFMGMWVAMMVAMMFPTVAPIVLAHRMVVQRRGEGATPTVAFVVGYLIVWSLIGVVPLVGFLAFRNLSGGAADSRWLPTLAGGILAGAGAYQFTRWKATCMKACRTPMSFLMTHEFGGGSRSAFRAGLSHGAYCLGCCWALMAVLVVVGLMNLVWMAAIALVFLAEKNWKHAVGLTKVIGLGLIGLGIAVIASPGILPTLSGAAGKMATTMGDKMPMGG
jgi:predicted metal-binding membrane protein